MRTRWRVDAAKVRANRNRLRISRALQRFGGLNAAESRIVSGDWPTDSWGELRGCLEALTHYLFQKEELLLAAPYVGMLYDLRRVEGAGDLAKLVARRAADYLHLAARKKSAPPAMRYWEAHFQTLDARICIDQRTLNCGAIPQNIRRLQDIVNDKSLLPFSRSEAHVELVGQYVRLDVTPDQVERKLQELRESLDPTYSGPSADWVQVAARLRPGISYYLERGHSSEPETRRELRRAIDEYGRIVLPQRSFRHTSLWAEWMRKFNEPVAVTIPEMTFHLTVPPIGSWA